MGHHHRFISRSCRSECDQEPTWCKLLSNSDRIRSKSSSSTTQATKSETKESPTLCCFFLRKKKKKKKKKTWNENWFTWFLSSSTHQFIWATILALGLYCLPESPKYLILKGREEEARAALGRLLSLPSDSEQVSREYDEVNESLLLERDVGGGSYADCFSTGKGRYRLRTLTGMGVQALQQLSG